MKADPAHEVERALPYLRLASKVEVEPVLDKAFAEAAAFLDPILAGRADGEFGTSAANLGIARSCRDGRHRDGAWMGREPPETP